MVFQTTMFLFRSTYNSSHYDRLQNGTNSFSLEVPFVIILLQMPNTFYILLLAPEHLYIPTKKLQVLKQV